MAANIDWDNLKKELDKISSEDSDDYKKSSPRKLMFETRK